MNKYEFAKESAEIVNSTAGVILADNTKYSFKKHPLLAQNMVILLEQSFKRIEEGKIGYISGLVEIGGKDYISLNYAGTDELIYLGLPRKRLESIDKIVKKNDIGYGMKIVPKNRNSVPYVLSNVFSSADLLDNINISDNDIFGSREHVKFKVNEHNYAKPYKDSYDIVMSPFNKN